MRTRLSLKGKKAVLQERIGEYNAVSRLHIQLMIGDKRVFSGPFARFMKFSGAPAYFALVGPKSEGII